MQSFQYLYELFLYGKISLFKSYGHTETGPWFKVSPKDLATSNDTSIFRIFSYSLLQIQRLNETVQHQSTFVSGETVTGTIKELSETVKALTTRLDGRDSTVNQQMLNLRNEIEEVKRESRRNAAYPNQK